MKSKKLSLLLAVLLLSCVTGLVQAQGNALNFDGSTQYITANLPMTQTDNITLEAWVNFNSLPAAGVQECIISYGFDNGVTGNGISICTQGTRLYFLLSGVVWADAGYNFTLANRWYHVALVRNSGTTKMYVDGVQTSLTTVAVPLAPTEFKIGSQNGIRFFNGRIDEVRIWNIARLQSEIQESMNSPLLTPYSSNLKAYYNFDSNSGSTLFDITGSFNGTLVNSPSWVESYAMVVPTATAATVVQPTSFTANWTAPTTGVVDNGYYVDVAIDKNFLYQVEGSPFSVSSTTYTKSIIDLMPGATYYYRVRADKNTVANQGGFSNLMTVTTIAPDLGNRLDYDGTDDYVYLGTTNMNSTEITIMGWMRWDGFNNWSRMVDFGNGQNSDNIVIANNGVSNTLCLSIRNGTSETVLNLPNLIPLGQFIHVAVVASAGNMSIYINGVLVGSRASVTIRNIARNLCYLGKSNWADAYFHGQMDEVSIWNKALTQAQIKAYSSNLTGTEDGLFAYYKFNQGISGGINTNVTHLYDKTANNLVGALKNFTLTNPTTSNFVGTVSTTAPVATAATDFTENGFTANWNTVVGATGYRLDISTASDFSTFLSNYKNKDVLNVNQIIVNDIPVGKTYYYRVRAYNDQGISGNSNQITVDVPMTTLGNALVFDGVDDFVDLPNSIATSLGGGSEITIEYWYRGTEIESAVRFQDGGGYIVAAWSPSNPVHIISTDGGTTGISIGDKNIVNNNKWHHVAMVWKKNTVNGFQSYLDGVLVAQRNSANVNLPPISSGCVLGKYPGGGEYLYGTLDEVRIWNVARTQQQLLDNMYNTIPPESSGLVAYYRFDQPSGTNLPDLTTNARHGTLTNGPVWTESYAMVVPKAAIADITSNSFTVNWTPPTNGYYDNYIMDVATDYTFQYPITGSPFNLTTAETSKSFTGLDPGTTYFCRVEANKLSVSGHGGSTNYLGYNAPMTAPGNALNFNGTDNYVSFPSNVSVNITSGTIEAWIKTPGAGGGHRGIVVKQNAYALFLYDNVLETFEWGGAGRISTGVNLADNKWHHVAMTFQHNVTNGSYIYIDGVQVRNFTYRINSNLNNLAIGSGDPNGTIQRFAGTIDEVRIWNTVKTPDEIRGDMSLNLSDTESNLMAYFRFDEGVAGGLNTGNTTLFDATSNLNFGKLNNFVLTGTSSNWVVSQAMLKPVAMAATDITETGFIAHWSKVEGATSYTLEVASHDAFTKDLVTYTGITDLSKSVTGLRSDVSYYYRVLALKGATSSDYSNIVYIPKMLPPGNALDFNGANNYVITKQPLLNDLTTFTVEGWFNAQTKTSDIWDNTNLFGQNDLLEFGITANVFWIWTYASGSVYFTYNINTNQWYHVAITKNGSVYNLFVNGVNIGTFNGSVSSASGSPFAIGAYVLDPVGGVRPCWFDGRFDEVRVWDVPRTQQEIQDNMCIPVDPASDDLLAYFKFDQGIAGGNNAGLTTLFDATKNVNNGNLVNFVLNGNESNWVESYAMVVPKAIAATKVTANSFTANWEAPPVGIVDKYFLDVSTNPAFTAPITGSPFIFDVKPLPLQYNVTGLGSQMYYYRVRNEKNSVPGQGYKSNTIAQATTSYTPPENALNFDGTNDFVITKKNIDIAGNAPRTLEFWYKKGTISTRWAHIINWGEHATDKGFGCLVSYNTNLEFYSCGGYSFDTGYDLDDAWHHIAVAYDGVYVNLYVDGIPTPNTNVPATLITVASPLVIGTNPSFITEKYNDGTIDEVRIWNIVRTQDEIQADMIDYIMNTDAKWNNLVAYYNFNQGIASGNNDGLVELYDQSSYYNNGNLYNIALNGSNSNWVKSFAMAVPTTTIPDNFTATTFNANWTPSGIGNLPNGYYIDVATDPNFTNKIVDKADVGNVLTHTVTGINPVMPYYYRVYAYSEAGTTTSSNITAVNSTEWTGAVSNDWQNPANWTPEELPGNAYIPAHAIRQPVVYGTVLCKSIYVSAGASLTIRPQGNLTTETSFNCDGTLIIIDNAIYNGTVTYGAIGSLIYSGFSPRVTADEFPSQVNNVYVKNASGITLNGTKTINGNILIEWLLNTNNFDIYLHGNWNSIRELDLGTSTLIMQGSHKQYIYGACTFYNLTIDNPTTVDASGASFLKITNLFKLMSGRFISK